MRTKKKFVVHKGGGSRFIGTAVSRDSKLVETPYLGWRKALGEVRTVNSNFVISIYNIASQNSERCVRMRDLKVYYVIRDDE